MARSARPAGSSRSARPGWWVLVDHPDQHSPRRVAWHDSEAAARQHARRLNAQSSAPDRPLYFVEHWCTSYVLDVENAAS